jgi:hypothetical protein
MFIVYTVGFLTCWIGTSLSATSGKISAGTVIGVIIALIYLIPLSIMLKYLRGEIVKKAIQVEPEQADG